MAKVLYSLIYVTNMVIFGLIAGSLNKAGADIMPLVTLHVIALVNPLFLVLIVLRHNGKESNQ